MLLASSLHDDRAVVVQRASGPGASRLRAEGERLRAFAHPGVVEVLRSTGDDEVWELHVAHGGRPVASMGSLPLDRIVGVMASAAATIADLHAAGLVHGHLDGSTVLIGADARAVLCGVGPSDGGAGPADDVQALGEVLRSLLAQAAPVSGAAWATACRRARSLDRALQAVVSAACSETPSRRPNARRLAAALASLGAPARPVGRPAHAATRPSPDRRRLIGPALLTIGLLTAALVRTVGEQAAGRGLPAPTGPPPSTAPAGAAGAVLEVGGRRFEVGGPGDVVVIGDWDCDGVDTPAVLRPTTGEVFVFAGWPTTDELTVEPVAVLDGAVDLVTVPGATGQSCDQLLARWPDGSTRAVARDRGA